jgi:LAS superfamily LD-carboxypeptidase LdcB
LSPDKLLEVTGRTTDHLTKLDEDYLVHKDALIPFNSLREEAKFAGFDLAAVSTFRPFGEQLNIWNNKATGKCALLSDSSEPLDFDSLSEEEIVFRILRWSALPGASRHHWGTDIDVIDRNGLPDSKYKVELVPSEYEKDGIFGGLSSWLDKRISNREAFGFYRPYDQDRSGVAPEMWHISMRPVANNYLQEYSFEEFKKFIESEAYSEMKLRDIVLDNAQKIYDKFVANVKLDY